MQEPLPGVGNATSPTARAQPAWPLSPVQAPGGARVRLVATDLDGTLLQPDGSVSSRTVEAVAAAQAAGMLVVPVTGRPPRVTWEAARTAGLGPLGACANGAAIVDVTSTQVVESLTLGTAACEQIVAEVRRSFPRVLFAVEDLECFTHEEGFMGPGWAWADDTHQVGDICGALHGRCMKLVARLPGWSARQLMAEVRARVEGGYQVTSSGLDWVEVAPPGATKAHAVQRLCARLGVGPDEVLAVGDHHNDLTVLNWAAHAAAPANAIGEVLAVADLVLPANSDDGVAVLLEALAASGGDVGAVPRHHL